MHSFIQDIWFAIRVLIKGYGTTSIAIIILALGIGANTAIFSLVNAVMFRPLLIEDPQRVVAFYETDESGTSISNCNYPTFTDLRDQCDAFSELCARDEPTSVHLGAEGVPQRVQGGLVSGNYFSMLGVKPALGRLFTPEDDRIPGGHPVAVLSHICWQNRFGADPSVVGREVHINGLPFNVIGVVESGFGGTTLYSPTEVWTTMMMQEQINPSTAEYHVLQSRQTRWMDIIGRLAPGVTLEQAQAQANVILIQNESAYADALIGVRAKLIPIRQALFWPGARGEVASYLQLLMVTVGLVMLIACANVANLLMARASGRRREIAIRLAIGAGRLRLIRQLLTESVLLAMLGGVAGLGLMFWINDLLLVLIEDNGAFSINALDMSLDGRVLGFTLGMSLLTGIIFGLIPALQASKPDLLAALKNDEQTPGRHWGRMTLQNMLVSGQVAVSMVLLIGAGLMMRSMTNAKHVDPGFDQRNVLIASMDLAMQGYDDTQGLAFCERLLERVRAVPGVERASLARGVPVESAGFRAGVDVEGYDPPDGRQIQVDMNYVDLDFFRAMGIGVRRGRSFTENDGLESTPITIINESMAQRFWPNESPIGHTIQTGMEDMTYEIVGVVGDSKYRNLREQNRPFAYFALKQRYSPRLNIVIRTSTEPWSMKPVLEQAIREVDSGLPLYRWRSLEDQVGEAMAVERATATIFSSFGALALVLASVGLYGVMASMVGRRVREIGIRMALGAERREVLRMILRHGFGVTIVGLVSGLGIALVSTRVIESYLFELSAWDPATYLLVALILGLVAMLACYLPARRASKVDPVVALRYE